MFVILRGNLLLALTYALTGWLALQIAIPPGYAAPLFPPAGIALGALLIYGLRYLPGVFAGALAVQILAASQTGMALVWSSILPPTLGAMLQAWFGYFLACRLLGRNNPLDSHESIIRFVTLVAPVGTVISPTVGVLNMMVQGAIPGAEIMFNWVNWWAGDTLGVLIMLPLLMVFFGMPAAEWRSRRLAVTVPMLIALGVLAMTFLQVSSWEERRLQSQLNRDAEHIDSLVRKRFDAQLDQMLALERLASVYPKLDAGVWREFVTPLLERYPGTQNFGWSPLVLDADRAAFESAARAAGQENFSILGRDPSGRTYVAEQRAEYLPIQYVEPLSSNRSVVGLDPLVLPQTAQAARQTRETRLPIASPSIRLVQESGEQRGVVVYHAVFAGMPVRQVGMVSGVFRMDDALIAALAGNARAALDVCLVDLEDQAVTQRLFGPPDCQQEVWSAQRLKWQKPLSFGGRQWLLKVAATDDYMSALRSWGVWLTLVVGLLSTAILGAFLLLSSGRARRVERLVEERTRQLALAGDKLEEQQEALLQAQRIARLGSWEKLPGSDICHCSDELCTIMGFGQHSMVTLSQLIAQVHPDDQVALRNALAHLAGTPDQIALDCRLGSRAANGTVLHFRIESDVRDGEGLRIRGTAQDVTSARAAEEHIAFLAHFDVLTGLPNRTQWNERAHAELHNASRQGDRLGVLFLDLDHFKAVNDSLGHPVGDQLLATVARRFSSCLRENDFLARLGGDEFVVLLPRLGQPEDAALVARKLIAVLQTPMLIEGHELTAAASIGIAIYPEDGEDVSALLKHADVAMYCAKDQGRNTYHYFMPEMDVHALERLMLENALRRAIEREELVLHYQPQVAADDGRVLGCEALVRWQHPELGLLQPAQFIGVAEESGLIVALGKWVLETACRQLAEWTAQGQHLVMAVNISALQFRQHGFSETVQYIVEHTGANPSLLELELTESALMQPTPEVLARMNHLRDLGIRLALDDFGTGYSSLSYLKRLPICRLKLDRSFVKDVPDDLEDVAIAMATLSLARDLGMDVVAEGVETERQRDFLAERACPVMQGYLFSRPLPAEAFLQWVRERQAG